MLPLHGSAHKRIENAAVLARANAPYINELLDEFPQVLKMFNAQFVDVVFDAVLDDITSISNAVNSAALDTLPDDTYNETPTLGSVMQGLRVLKRKAHLIIALLDLATIWDWREVTHAMTRLADCCVNAALRFAAFDNGLYHENDNPAAGLFVLALGKYGAFELNYSSDIDIIVFYDPDYLKIDPDKPTSRPMEKTMIRLTQKFVKVLDTLNGDGYVFRTDLRLRPDPRSNAIAVSTRTAERYYETLGQNWERAAMIKARVCAGDHVAGAQFMDEVIAPYIWRRNLDYAAIDDIQAMKRQILAVGKHGAISAAGHHLKLGLGGIREVEFYAQTQQLILGGRHPELREITTEGALQRLAQMEYISEETAQSLIDAYGVLRGLEHRAQLIEDAQTHISPKDDVERLSLAKLAGFDELAGFDAHLISVLSRVHEIYSALFPQKESLALEAGNLSFTGVDPDPGTLQTLASLGYERGGDVWSLMAAWLGGRVLATRTQRARESLTRLAPSIIKGCADTGLADTAFFHFADFFTKLRRGVSILAMFEGQPEFLATIISIMAQAPRLANELSSQPSTIDAMIEPDFYDFTEESLAADYAELGTPEDDLETAMNLMRRRVREDHFRVCAGLLTQRVTPAQAAPLFSAIAQAAVQRLVSYAARDVERRLECPGGCFAIIALGKMGGREMSVTSDLDLMMIYKPKEAKDPDVSDDHMGKAHLYYTKLTQRIISALSAATQEGEMFDVDMALRPSGGSGPITVSLKAFDSYYAQQAWTWEFMALTRARIVYASDAGFKDDMEARFKALLCDKREQAEIRKDVIDMRARLLRDKGPRGDWDIKRVAGGVIDIEFCSQYLQLVYGEAYPEALSTSTQLALKNLESAGVLPREDFEVLSKALSFYTQLTQYLALALGGVFEPNNAPDIVTRGLIQVMDVNSFETLEADYLALRDQVKDVFDRVMR